MRVAVAGGTGTLGKHVVQLAAAAGHEILVLSRSTGIDLMTGDGLAAALKGVDALIDASAISSTSTKQSRRFFGTVTHNLREAERAAGVRHHVALSIIGAATVDSNYYAGKALQEAILFSDSRHDWSLLRTTQFHEFAQQLVHGGKVGPFQLVPTMRSQPIAATEVAHELVRIVSGEPRGLEPDLAGPMEENMADLVKRYLHAVGTPRPVVRISLPGPWGKGMRNGTLLPTPGVRLAHETFADWLSTQRA